MPSLKDKFRSRSASRGTRGKRIRKYVLLGIASVFVFLLYFAFTVVQSCEHIDTSKIYSYISQSSVIYDDHGKIFDNIYLSDGNRQNVAYSKMPKNLINAAVSIEDKTFWKHHGFNFIRMGGAIFDSFRKGGGISGTSTITQQLARNVYLASSKSDRTITRKISEAYYTVVLEKDLSKEKIMEAYLNTIYFGFGSYGIETAAQTYFNKSVDKLDLAECAALMAIPNSPDNFSLVKTISNRDIASGAVKVKSADILMTTSEYTMIYNGEVSRTRREVTLDNMYKYGYITKQQMEAAKKEDLKKQIDLSAGGSDYSEFFTDFVVEQVKKDLLKDGYSEENANKLIYTGGLKIYTSLNRQAQSAIESHFKESYNFPSVANVRYDGNGNVVSDSYNVILYKYGNYFDDNGAFRLNEGEFSIDADGNMVIGKNGRLLFAPIKDGAGNNTYSISFRNMYIKEDGAFYVIEGGNIEIDSKYKSLNKNGDLVISAQFFKDEPNFFKKSGSSYIVEKGRYVLNAKVRQPQAAMVIVDNKTGAVKAMVGGRGSSGSMLYNRAESPRQPGSSIKPLAIYSSALQQGAEAAQEGQPMSFSDPGSSTNPKYYGSYWTAASFINDAALTINGKVWPKNWYSGYRGEVSLRNAVEQSINVCAVRVWQQLDNDYIVSQLKKFGVTSVISESNNGTNDMNAAALALGGMTRGISPLEMASAYTTFQNGGTHIAYTAYTEVKDSNGKVILKTEPEKTKVLDESVAFIMSDILRTTVTNGIAGAAQVSGQTTAGKTGTTSDNFDAWFCGFTPQYSAAIWIGNDYNIELSQGSAAAARLWGRIMSEATAGLGGSFASQPSSVVRYGGEYFADGTQHGVVNYADQLKKKQDAEKKKKLEEAKKKLEEEKKKAAEQNKTPTNGTTPGQNGTTQTPGNAADPGTGTTTPTPTP